jgi:transcriptional regulator GlxA family with amidase domain
MNDFVDVLHYDRLRARVTSDLCTTRQVGVVVFNEFALPETAAILDTFRPGRLAIDAQHGNSAHYDVCLLSTTGGTIASSSSVHVCTERIDTGRPKESFHALLIAGGAGVSSALRDERLIEWLRQACKRSELVYPIAEGALLVEAAGFVEAAAGHCCPAPARVFPAKYLNSGHSINTVKPPQVSPDLIPESLRTMFARQAAENSSSPDETPFTRNLRLKESRHVTDKIRASARWLDERGDRHIAIGDAAQVAAMSERNFLRRFKIEMGITPSDYLLYVRLDMACRLLLNTDLPIDKIARRSGIGTGGGLAKIFRKHLSTTPTEYRTEKKLCRNYS